MRISVTRIAEELKAYSEELKTYSEDLEDGEGNVGEDVRLQVVDGSWELHTGDSSYDQDHRGRWGASWVRAGASMAECRGIARDLIDEALGG